MALGFLTIAGWLAFAGYSALVVWRAGRPGIVVGYAVAFLVVWTVVKAIP